MSDVTAVIEDGSDALLVGRNGTWDLTAVVLNQGGGWCAIDGVGKRGNILRGGMMIPVEAMDKLAFGWLEHRNYVAAVNPDV